MILQALVEHYEDLAAQGKLARPGWSDTTHCTSTTPES